jgi:hypothetical protein
MASSINALTSGAGGLITTADNSGNLNIQSGGTTVVAVTSAGANIVGTLTVNGVAPVSGKVLQVVNAFETSTVSNSTATYVDTGLTATITPTSATSKILVLVNQNGVAKSNGGAGVGNSLRLLRNASAIINFQFYAGYTNTAVVNYIGTVGTCYLDSPATTSATTYKTQFRSESGGVSVSVQNDSSASTIPLLEIAA